ncbi:histidine kinase [Microbacterium sp. H1-D42]|uniref:sensor histidine kinase n=1 Tax=Microbacterium sp. H1-D42 TaxID=2925844 RepID=UPI001F5340A3|nr:histidine kinase [Microbacterium sp. H1-D42]UNK70065.1 histidine kinase [Microbacterium sp. H1-D42]
MSSVAGLLRQPFAAALLCGAWVTFFLLFESPGVSWSVWLVVPLSMGAIALLNRHPLTAAMLALAASAVSAWAGIPYGQIELLLPSLYVLGYLGRKGGSVALGGLAVVAFGALAAMRVDAPWYAFPVSVLVHAAAWVFGLVIRRRAAQAVDAARKSAALAAVDLERTMSESARTSRLRASEAALDVLRSAVHRMCELAHAMHQRGLPYRAADAESIRREGDRAIGQLHETLTMLDDEDDAAGARRRPHRHSRSGGEGRSPDGDTVDVAHAAGENLALAWWMGVPLLAASVAAAVVLGDGNAYLMQAAIIVPLCIMIVHRVPLLAGVAAGGALAVVAIDAGFEPDALLPLGVGVGTLIWQLTRMPAARGAIPLIVLIAGALMLGAHFGPRGFGFIAVLAAFTFGAATAWKERDDILHTEQARSVRLLAAIAAASLRAERAERMLLSRELHDGVSHGITAMSLQTGAAHALCAKDPDRARRSMTSVLAVGERTLDEIDALARGRPGDEGDTGLSLDTLIEGARATGLQIRHRPIGEADLLSYRIVQEALTNITRYAPGARVVIETGGDGMKRFVRVCDSGAAPMSDPFTGARRALESLGRGRGLPGLADRVAEYGGRFRAGPRDAGFEVYAEWRSSREHDDGPAVRDQGRET